MTWRPPLQPGWAGGGSAACHGWEDSELGASYGAALQGSEGGLWATCPSSLGLFFQGWPRGVSPSLNTSWCAYPHLPLKWGFPASLFQSQCSENVCSPPSLEWGLKSLLSELRVQQAQE